MYESRRRAIFRLQNGNCYICSRKMCTWHWENKPSVNGKMKANAATFDHVVSTKYTRTKTKSRNVLLAHYSCNHKKGSRNPTACEMFYLSVINDLLLQEWGEMVDGKIIPKHLAEIERQRNADH